MAYYLAIDAGGTKTEFLLADEERELASALTGTIKRMRADEETTGRNLRAGLSKLTEISKVSPREITRTCIGTAGNTVPLVTDWLRKEIGALAGGELVVVGDVEIALDSPFRGGRGVLVLAGTGSNVAGRAADGSIFTAGGWGPALADQGSGHFLGLEGLRRGFLAIDQQRPTTLLEAIREHWKLPSIEMIVEFANARPAPNYAGLAPVVVECAAQGDGVAMEILKQGGRDLADLAGLVIERMRRVEAGRQETLPIPGLAVAGSILREVPPLREAMEDSLRETYPGISVLKDAVEPIQGALWRARLN